MNNVRCELCGETADLDSDEMSQISKHNKVHHECLVMYWDWLEGAPEPSTVESGLLADIFEENMETQKRRDKTFNRIIDGNVRFIFRRI